MAPPTPVFAQASAVGVQPDSKILVAGRAGTDLTYSVVARYNRDGTLDGTFGTGGQVATNPDGKLPAAAQAVAIPGT